MPGPPEDIKSTDTQICDRKCCCIECNPYTLFYILYLLLKYLFIWKSEIERQRKNENLPSSGSLPGQLKWPGPGQASQKLPLSL